MEAVSYLTLCFIFVFSSYGSCHDNDVILISRMDDLDDDIVDVRNDLLRIEEKVKTKIDLTKISLRSELNQHIKEQVRKAMAEILQGESLEEMVRSQVVSEVRQLKHGHHQMKRQLHHVMKTLRDVQEDRDAYKESLMKIERNVTEFLTCSKFVVKTKILERDLERYTNRIKDVEDENKYLKQNLRLLNETCSQDVTAVSESDQTSKIETILPSTVPFLSTTASFKPEEERNRIIAVPYRGYKNQFRQINIHSNSPTNYPYLTMSNVRSLAYVSKSRKLLIGLDSPIKIVSSYLDTYGVKTVREGVWTMGMAVDEERELVFLTTRSPRHTISRMSTQGKHFTTIALLVDYTHQYAIAVNPKQQKIYSCNNNKLFMMTYDGRVIQTLATRSEIYAVTLDNTGALYYNDDKTLMKMTWSQNSYSTTNVTTLEGRPWNLLYYKNTVYFSSNTNIKTIGVIDIEYDLTVYNLKAFEMKLSYSDLHICLVP